MTNPYEISPEWVMQLKSRFRSIGCIVSPDKQFWQEIYASAEWSPFYKKCYSGAFKGSGAGLQTFAVMEKYLLREKMVHCLYYHPADMQSLREVFNDAMTKKQIDGAKIDELLKRSDGEVEVRTTWTTPTLTGLRRWTTLQHMEEPAFPRSPSGRSTILRHMHDVLHVTPIDR